jgi:septal ring factor EnvC (AmiA/AmiB activator)
VNNKSDPNTWDEYEPLIGGDDLDNQVRIKTLNQTLNSLLHQVEDLSKERDTLVSALNEANFRAQSLEQLKRAAEDELAALNTDLVAALVELGELRAKEPPLLQCIDCRNTESCAGAMARQFNHGRCLHCGGYFKVVRA